MAEIEYYHTLRGIRVAKGCVSCEHKEVKAASKNDLTHTRRYCKYHQLEINNKFHCCDHWKIKACFTFVGDKKRAGTVRDKSEHQPDVTKINEKELYNKLYREGALTKNNKHKIEKFR